MNQADPDTDSLGTWGYGIHSMYHGNSVLLVTGASYFSQSTFESHMSTMELNMGSHQSYIQSLKMTITDIMSLFKQSLPKYISFGNN